MQITDSLLLGNARFGTNTSYEGLLNLQPIIYTMSEGSRTCTYFTQFGNNFFIRPWSFEQEKIENIIKTGKATHKVIKEKELEFLLAYNEVPELNLDFLYTLVGNSKRCTFILSNKNLQTILLSTDSFAKKFKSKTRTYQYKEDASKLNNNYVFTLSIYSIDTIVANLKNKTIDGLGIAVEVFNKQYTQHYKTPYVSYGYYFIFTNNYDDVLYRDCVEILPQSSFDSLYIYEQVRSYERYCNNTKQQKQENPLEDVKKVYDYFKKVSIGKGIKPGKMAVLATKKVTEEPPIPEEAPGFYAEAQLKYEDFYIDKQSLYQQDISILDSVPLPVQEQILEQKIQNDIVDVDFNESLMEEAPHKKVKMKKVSPKKVEDLWGDIDASLAQQNPNFENEYVEKLETQHKKEDLYKKLYNGSLKAIHAEMVSEIAKDISEKQKIRSSTKATSQRFHAMPSTSTWDTSATATYSSVSVSPAMTTIKIKMT